VRVRGSLFALLAALLVSCNDEEKPFLPLPELCPRVAADICRARELCACETGIDNCEKDELARCKAESAVFKAEVDLKYQADEAISVANEQVQSLEACDPPFPLGRFFQHTHSEGDACERDAQCESGSCDPDTLRCAAPEAGALCPEP
jgi:hypothetical protein